MNRLLRKFSPKTTRPDQRLALPGSASVGQWPGFHEKYRLGLQKAAKDMSSLEEEVSVDFNPHSNYLEFKRGIALIVRVRIVGDAGMPNGAHVYGLLPDGKKALFIEALQGIHVHFYPQ